MRWAQYGGLGRAVLAVKHASAAKALRKSAPSARGSVIRYGHNAHPKGSFKVYGRKRNAPGGTILIDASSSMSINGDTIARALELLPAATVAMYCGKRDSGSTCIIAERGKMATDREIQAKRDEMGGVNAVDGPALEWLAQQKGAKAWVSDGMVNGVRGAAPSRKMIMQVNRIMDRARIPRYETLGEAVEKMAKGMVDAKRGRLGR